MYYQHSITILSDGKMVTARDNKTGQQAQARCAQEDMFDLPTAASLAIKWLLEKECELKVGDRVQFITDKFDTNLVYQYATEFVDELDIPNPLK